jgi:5'-nucleotidase
MDALLKYDRRTFLKYSASLAIGTVIPNIPFVSEASHHTRIKITILHTNDWHSRIDSFSQDDKYYPGLGGAEARSALIRKIRSEEEHVLLLDAGDIFQGTPYFNFYKGELEYKLMTEMGYDCVTLGNHDFDNGIEGLIEQLPNAGFQLVNCNYDFSRSSLQEYVRPFITMQKGPIKIGIFGLGIELNGLVPEKLHEGIQCLDPISNANRIATELREEHSCDLVICLSHLGFEYKERKISDKILAESTKNIDLIIGGHTHTFLDIPYECMNLVGDPVLINQVGWAGINLGRIDFYFERGKRKREYLSHLLSVKQSV